LCTFLYTGELLAANPMQLVGRPKLAKPLPKALPRIAVEALLETVAHDHGSQRQIDWAECDLAIILSLGTWPARCAGNGPDSGVTNCGAPRADSRSHEPKVGGFTA
jgi:hypothetical protein